MFRMFPITSTNLRNLARDSRARLSYARQADNASARRAAGAGPQDFHTYTGAGSQAHRSVARDSWIMGAFPPSNKNTSPVEGAWTKKNWHRHIVYAPNAKQSAWLIRICDYSLLFLIRTKPAHHPCTDIRPASPARLGFQSAGSRSFSVNSASMSSTGCAPSWASSTRFMLSNAWGYSCRMAASRATISSRESWSSW